MHGWIFLNKPRGISSQEAIFQVKKMLQVKKVGHLGTLDPLATGVLVVAIGEATKLIPYVNFEPKKYLFQVCWGEERETDDLEGKVITTSAHRPTQADIYQILKQFIGKIDQIPPKYSAIKVKGVPAYKKARKSLEFSLGSRTVNILSLKLLSIDDSDHATFEVVCGGGTYIRALARDMGRALGAKAYTSQLIRLQVGKIMLEHTILLENLRYIAHKEEWWQVLKEPSSVLDDIPAVTLAKVDAFKIRQGQAVAICDASGKEVVSLWQKKELLAIAQIKEGKAYPKRVFLWQ